MITVETKVTFDDVVMAAMMHLSNKDILDLCSRLIDIVDDDDLFRDWVENIL